MSIFKAPNDDTCIADVAPTYEWVEITEEELQSIYTLRKVVPPPPTLAQQLDQLDAANTLTQRNLRETVMLMAEAFKQVTAGAVDLSAIPGVAKVYEV
jgi:hypothetical protein